MNLSEVTCVEDARRVYKEHRDAAHGGDQESFFDCAVCGAIDSRLGRLKREEAQAQVVETVQ